MTNLIQDVMKDAANPRKLEIKNTLEKDTNGQVLPTQSREGAYDDTIQTSAPLHTLAEESTRKTLDAALAETLPKSSDSDDEVRELLSATVDDGREYQHPRHFAQIGQRQGLTIYIGTANSDGQAAIPIKFEKGVFSTTDIQLVKALELGLSRRGGLQGQYRQISVEHYQSIIGSSKAYERLRGTQNIVGTSQAKTGADQHAIAEMKSENDRLRAQIAEMQASVAAVQNETEKQETSSSMFANSASK